MKQRLLASVGGDKGVGSEGLVPEEELLEVND